MTVLNPVKSATAAEIETVVIDHLLCVASSATKKDTSPETALTNVMAEMAETDQETEGPDQEIEVAGTEIEEGILEIGDQDPDPEIEVVGIEGTAEETVQETEVAGIEGIQIEGISLTEIGTGI